MVIVSTGLTVFGKGEWHLENHGSCRFAHMGVLRVAALEAWAWRLQPSSNHDADEGSHGTVRGVGHAAGPGSICAVDGTGKVLWQGKCPTTPETIATTLREGGARGAVLMTT